ncbi:MAG: hypothetical protein M0P91_13980 [Sulfuricurvum sp.]|jgi:hypothetical protein|uniref:hypothetical protein n=1 Tax=Sulfuricurvum sp. TaxID=2025608 RepID=UPI0025DFFCDC|nr:hypothetical protein [Sulfuricurvum sp.]MCK9374286.1 hypothetical protein [Sulfuricurvum sp.]
MQEVFCLEEASFSAQAASVVLWALLKARLKESSARTLLNNNKEFMMNENLRSEVLKHARTAFERSCTLRDDERLEVYLYDGNVKVSDVLSEDHTIIYSPNRVLCYQVWGHDYLEEEIRAWIDHARLEITPKPLEESILETLEKIAAEKGVSAEEISSYEVFANLRMDQLEQIEHAIIEYWWDNKEVENAKSLALEQINHALMSLEG